MVDNPFKLIPPFNYKLINFITIPNLQQIDLQNYPLEQVISNSNQHQYLFFIMII